MLCNYICSTCWQKKNEKERMGIAFQPIFIWWHCKKLAAVKQLEKTWHSSKTLKHNKLENVIASAVPVLLDHF